MPRPRSPDPAPGTIRSQRSRELEALGFFTDRITYEQDGEDILIGGGWLTIGCKGNRAARAQALSDFITAALAILHSELLLQHVPNAVLGPGYSLRKRRD